jgi:NitT/TauT family transport system permease protein
MVNTNGKKQENLVTRHFRQEVEAKYQEIYAGRRQQAQKNRTLSMIEGTIGVIAFIALWYIMAHTLMDKVPDPIVTITTIVPRLIEPWYYKSIFFSLYRVLLGFVVASVLAIPMGLLMGWNRIARDILTPGFELMRPVPPVAWVPLSIIIFSQLEYSIVFITFTGAFFVVTLNARLGAESIDQSLFRAAWCLGASPRQIFRHIVLPGALPAIFTGLALGIGISWETVVAAEMIAGQYGLGYLTWESYNLIRYPEVILSMVSIGILGYICSAIIRNMANRYLAWRKVFTQ